MGASRGADSVELSGEEELGPEPLLAGVRGRSRGGISGNAEIWLSPLARSLPMTNTSSIAYIERAADMTELPVSTASGPTTST